jgi:hypothetical protein
MFRYKLDVPLWSCCFDSKDMNIVYAGASNGSIFAFDLRKTIQPVVTKEFIGKSRKLPIHSLFHVSSSLAKAELLVGTLDSIAFLNFDMLGSVDFDPILFSPEVGQNNGN